MKWILWLGIVPLFFGIKYLWQWGVKDRENWDFYDEKYKSMYPIRVVIAIGLILFGLWLFSGVGDYLSKRY